jgi:thiamine biosynthesis lipoprotein
MGGRPRLHHEEEVMGTVVVFDLYLREDSSAVRSRLRGQLQDAVAVLHEADVTFSTYREDSPVKRLARGEVSLDEVDPIVGQVLETCRDLVAVTDGWFDPWALPEPPDPTGYVKGWAAQRALDQIDDPSLGGALVNAAGDVLVRGAPSDDEGFRAGIVDPHDVSRVAAVVAPTAALATSATYERGEHLVHPRAGSAVAAVASASVCGPDLGWADALATALAVGGQDVLDLIDDLAGYSGLIITAEGSMRASGDFPIVGRTR